MAEVYGPYVKVRCSRCRDLIEARITAKRAVQNIDDIKDTPRWLCALCSSFEASEGDKLVAK